jgi:1-phosphofructokinase family hexose kinase
MNKIFTLTLNPAVDRELTVPEIVYDSVLRAAAWRVDYGGKGFNVSRMLQALGAPSTALGFAGGKSGELLQEGLESLEIQTNFVWIAGETRTNVSVVAEDSPHYLKVNEPGPIVSADEQGALIDKVTALAAPGDWWVLAGSLPPGVPQVFYRRLVEIIQDKGAQVVLDTSGEALALGCQAGPSWAKPNDVELQELTGLPTGSITHTMAAARALQVRGVPHVLVSMGKRGALLAAGEEAWHLTSPTVQERNPIGAGDSLVGGLVWGLTQGLSLVESTRWGLACGAAAASLSGTAVGSRDLVESLFTKTGVQPLR